MTALDATPLGYSDLTDDECFVISAFRRWTEIRPLCAIAEKHLQEDLRWDRLSPRLGSLFEIFRSLPSQTPTAQAERSALLTTIEEILLDKVGTRSQKQDPSVIEFQSNLDGINGTTRCVSDIPRSGHDCLFEKVNQQINNSYRSLYSI